jgi:type I restriction enzyme R subunit
LAPSRGLRELQEDGNGLKGQLATASNRDAIRYKKALDDTGLVTSAIVISPPDIREGADDTEYERLPGLHRKMWSFFREVTDRADPEQLH